MEIDQITVYLRYHSLDFYGKSEQITMIVPSKITLGELKERVWLKIKINPEHQSMTLKQINRIIPIEDDAATLDNLGIK